MKLLLTVMAIIEGAAGIALLIVPSAAGSMLLGVPLDTPAGLVVGRIAGAALVALGLSCWGAHRDEHDRAANGIVSAMLLYNVGAGVVLAYAGLGLRLSGVGLWPAVVLHALMAVWCLVGLWESLNRSRLRGMLRTHSKHEFPPQPPEPTLSNRHVTLPPTPSTERPLKR